MSTQYDKALKSGLRSITPQCLPVSHPSKCKMNESLVRSIALEVVNARGVVNQNDLKRVVEDEVNSLDVAKRKDVDKLRSELDMDSVRSRSLVADEEVVKGVLKATTDEYEITMKKSQAYADEALKESKEANDMARSANNASERSTAIAKEAISECKEVCKNVDTINESFIEVQNFITSLGAKQEVLLETNRLVNETIELLEEKAENNTAELTKVEEKCSLLEDSQATIMENYSSIGNEFSNFVEDHKLTHMQLETNHRTFKEDHELTHTQLNEKLDTLETNQEDHELTHTQLDDKINKVCTFKEVHELTHTQLDTRLDTIETNHRTFEEDHELTHTQLNTRLNTIETNQEDHELTHTQLDTRLDTIETNHRTFEEDHELTHTQLNEKCDNLHEQLNSLSDNNNFEHDTFRDLTSSLKQDVNTLESDIENIQDTLVTHQSKLFKVIEEPRHGSVMRYNGVDGWVPTGIKNTYIGYGTLEDNDNPMCEYNMGIGYKSGIGQEHPQHEVVGAMALGYLCGGRDEDNEDNYQESETLSAGYMTSKRGQSKGAVALGPFVASESKQGARSTATGNMSAISDQGEESCAYGHKSGYRSLGKHSTCVGSYSGQINAGVGSTCVGTYAGMGTSETRAGDYSTLLGFGAGKDGCPDNVIIISAMGNEGKIKPTSSKACYIDPIRKLNTTTDSTPLYYNHKTKEVYTYSSL